MQTTTRTLASWDWRDYFLGRGTLPGSGTVVLATMPNTPTIGQAQPSPLFDTNTHCGDGCRHSCCR